MEDPSIDIIFNIAATPKGVAINLNPINATRGRGSLRSPHPLAMVPEPPRGVPITRHSMLINKEELMLINNVG